MAENEKRLSEEELDSVAGGFGERWYYTGDDYDLDRVARKYGEIKK